jgi:hypothetical protein
MPTTDLSQWLQRYDRRKRSKESAAPARGQPGARLDLWASFIQTADARQVAEIGVYAGKLSERLLNDCPGIESYYMVDPWRHLDAWNKPANRKDSTFEEIYAKAMSRTEANAAKRVVLRGTLREVIDELPDGLDFAYLDGDHTLRGITIDLVSIFPKIREGGWIGGDDFRPSIWQHGSGYEPTLVFPYAVYFAEAVGVRIYGLPYRQFLIEKSATGFEFVDLTGRFRHLDLRSQMKRGGGLPRPGGKRRRGRRTARGAAKATQRRS